ncbi:nucleobase:cation symporter-2 family protein [uncultured Variovorax sp.]|uniref:nucleobase:cation symporter-2 family protein n=1 Tax=uncultured Variovorax sp. TaxID=114708 RepID=UPI0025E2744B|nr:nucleobase:cation symporter-2 family protein [uncultured Variovorax sp.]
MNHTISNASPGASADVPLPIRQLLPLGLQHVLVMYAGAVAIPLIVGRALMLSPEQVALLISADLFCCGIATIIQSRGLGGAFGIRQPVMMGVTFAAVPPMLAIAGSASGETGLRLMFGAIIGAGVIGLLLAKHVSRLVRYFPPIVTGTLIAVIGVTLMRVGIGWLMGGPPQRALIADGPAARMVPNPSYASLEHIALGLLVLAVIILVARYAKGFLANISVLAGIVVGGALAAALGKMNFDKVAKAPWFDTVSPFAFGMPIFDPVMILTMSLVMLVVMIESTGMFLALGELCGKPVTERGIAAGLRTDALGTLIGGIFNTFPYTSYSQNVGLIGITGVRSRYVCVTGGVILLLLGLTPKMAALVESLPQFVLGGAGLVMFGMVAATGIRILSKVDFGQRHNGLIVAVSMSLGMLPVMAPNWTQHMPRGTHPMLESGILLAALSAMLLNLLFNRPKALDDARRDAAGATVSAE